jgi:hypothetical protein
MFGFQKVSSVTPQTIAVCGTEHGIGTTHFALSLSNYLCSKYRKRTAYVELNGSNQIRSLSDDPDMDTFFYMDIACYPSSIAEDLNRILAERFSYIILDLGVLTSDTCREFYRCDLKFIIGSVSPWKAGRFYDTLESLLYNTNPSQDHIVILGNLGIKETLRDFQRFCGCQVYAIPFLQNPFQLTTANCTFFQEMLAKNGILIPR